MKFIDQLSIAKKIWLLINLPLFIVMMTINFFLISIQANTLIDLYSEFGNDVARNAAEMVNSALYHQDYYFLNTLVESLQKYPDNLWTNIYDNNGLVYTPASKKPVVNYRNYSLFREDIIFNDSKLGFVEIALDNKEQIHKIFWYSIQMTSITILLMFLIQLLLHYSIRKIVIRPLNDMLGTIAGISKGNLEIEINVSNQDEIGNIASNFNQMVKKMRDHIAITRSILESMPSTILAIDKKARIINFNSHIRRFLDLPAPASDESVSQTTTNKSAIPPLQEQHSSRLFSDDLHELKDAILWDLIPYFNTYKKVSEYVLYTQKPIKLYREAVSKTEFYQFFIFPLVNSDVNGLVFRIDDVTNEEKKDEQLREALKMETIGALASGLAHDFNNVLCGIVSTISILKFKLQNKSTFSLEKIESLVSVIDESAIRAEEMVKQFLGLARKQEMHFTKVDLNNSITNISKIGKNSFDKSVEIRTVLYPEKAMAIVDKTQIEQVFLNLALNGSHAMTIMKKNNWGGILEIKIEEIRISDTFKKAHIEAIEEYYWKISFSDQGVGMSPEIREKIFEPFFTTKEVGKGTGLGLAMVFNILSNHNGFIHLESELGIGSSFQVFLPKIINYEVEEVEENKEVIVYHGNHEHILVVDDELVVRQTINHIGEEANYMISLAESSLQAASFYKKHAEDIDLVLINFSLPNLNGVDLFLELQKMNPKIKAILTCGLSFEEIQDKIKMDWAEDIFKMGFKKFIQKPFTITQLTKTITEVLSES